MWEPRKGSVVYHAKAVFGPGVVVGVRDDPEFGRMFTVLWQSTGQTLDHTRNSLQSVPAEIAGKVQ